MQVLFFDWCPFFFLVHLVVAGSMEPRNMFLLVVSLNPHNDPSGLEDDKVGPDEKGLDLSPPQLNTSNNNGIINLPETIKSYSKISA